MRFEEWFERSGLKKKFVAKALNVSPSYLTLLCQGKRLPSFLLSIRISEFTNGAVTATDHMDIYRQTRGESRDGRQS